MKRVVVVLALLCAGVAAADAGDTVLANYRAQGAGPFAAAAGQALWTKQFPATDGGAARSCTTCHGADPRRAGKHAQTGKPIEPMALSANAKRFTEVKFIEKWFLRNCKWTLGRECTAQEKGDVLTYLRGL